MEMLENVLFFRGIERLVIILFSGLSLVLGWHLFKIGVLSEQKSEIKAGDNWIKLQKVGPGVFFALFGAIVFVHSLSSPFNFELLNYKEAPNSDGKDPQLGIKGTYFTQNEEKYLTLSKSINTIREIYETITNPNMSYSDKQLLLMSISNLEKERDTWIVNYFGTASLALWNLEGNQYLISPTNVDQKAREQLKAIEPWLAGTLRTKEQD